VICHCARVATSSAPDSLAYRFECLVAHRGAEQDANPPAPSARQSRPKLVAEIVERPRSSSSTVLRYVYPSHRGRKVAAGRQTIPDLAEVSR
jgi:hypothetical protein